MKAKLKQWGATLVVLGAASLVLPFVGIQLRIFNLFGTAQTKIGIAAIVGGAVMWFLGNSRERALSGAGASAGGSSASWQSPGAGVATPPPPGTRLTCPNCGAEASAADRFCIECGTPLAQAIPITPTVGPPPKKPRRLGRKIFLVLLLLIAAAVGWFFIAPGKSYKPPASRAEPALPPRMAGTLTEFPVDVSGGQPMKPGNLVSQTFEPPGTPGMQRDKPSIQAPPETLPPGFNTNTIPQQAAAMTSCTYRIDPQSPPVHVHVLQTGGNVTISIDMARGIAQATGGAMQGARVQSPQGQMYDGFIIRALATLVYILTNPSSGNTVVLYAPQPASFDAAQRLAKNVGNGRGLRDYPELTEGMLALPSAPPPGYQMAEMRNFTGAQLQDYITKGEAQLGKDKTAEIGRLIQAVRAVLPDHGTTAIYRNTAREEKGVLIGKYASARKAAISWRTLSMTLGMAMKKEKLQGSTALTMSDSSSRIMLFQKGPYIGLVKVPASASPQDLAALASSIQL